MKIIWTSFILLAVLTFVFGMVLLLGGRKGIPTILGKYLIIFAIITLFFPMLLSYLGFDVWFWSYVVVVSGIVVLTIIGVVRRVSHYLHDEHERRKSES